MFMMLSLSILIVVGCNNQITDSKTQNKKRLVKIGVLDDLTGDYANLMRGTSRGVRLAVKDLKNKEDIDINLIIEDLESCNPEKATTAMHKLSNIDRVDFIIGGNCSNVTLNDIIRTFKPLDLQQVINTGGPKIILGQPAIN